MDLSKYPRRADRKIIAQIITQEFFPVSPRTIEAWPLPVRRVNGKATLEVAEAIAFAQAKLDAAPVLMGGRRAPVRAHG